MNRHRSPFFLKIILFSLALIASPANAFAAAAPSRLVIGYASTTPRLMPLWMARDQGFFAKYGIESEPVLLRSRGKRQRAEVGIDGGADRLNCGEA